MATTTADKCPNTTPLNLTEPNGRPARDGICPECGGFLAILASGRFRTHKRVMQPGNPRIAENVRRHTR